MKRYFVLGFVVVCLIFTARAALAYDDIRKHPSCKACGMDREKFAHSRMLIEYDDGATDGTCSIHCAAAVMKKNPEKRVKALLVADYGRKELIDAKAAAWVVGGGKAGVMTAVPKWAFARDEDGQKFIAENGGRLLLFSEVMEAASSEAVEKKKITHDHHGHAGHDMPGGQMIYNPAVGDQIYHTHPAGMWMVNYRFMHMTMNGLRDGITDVPSENVGFRRGKQYNFMMIPTSMSMNMHMGMVMYGITDRLTVMAMGNYQENKMRMLMDMGPGRRITEDPPMRTSGIGDTELRGMYKINQYLVGSLGVSLPTGSINENFRTMRQDFRAPYDMQLGSGTVDLKPALTYNGLSDNGKWNWGAQAQYTWHPYKNANEWAYGDNIKVTSWIQRALGPFTTWGRLAFNSTARIRGEDPTIRLLNHPIRGMGASMPDADPNNYGGQRLDGLIGVSFTKGCFSLGVEGGVPLYQYVNGLQLKTDWLVNAGAQIMF